MFCGVLKSVAVAEAAGRDASSAIARCLTYAGYNGDGESGTLIIGLLILLHLFGFSGDSLISGAIGDGAERDTAEEVEAYIKESVDADSITR